MDERVLVAGIGNLFLSDDGFGPEVARFLTSEQCEVTLVDEAQVIDYGIRGMHLAIDLLDGVRALIIIDAMPGDGSPGDLVVMQVGEDDVGTVGLDAHGMDPLAVLGSLRALGGSLPPTFVVGCRPASVEEGLGLSPAVQAAVPVAAEAVARVINEHVLAHTHPSRRD